MARFKFGKRKKPEDSPRSHSDHSRNTSQASQDTSHSLESEERPLYLRRPLVGSRHSQPAPVEEVPQGPPPGNALTPWRRHKLYGLPFPRYRHAALLVASDKGEIFIMGGLKEGLVFGDTWRLEPVASGSAIEAFKAQHVEIVNQNPPARVGHALVLCGNAYIVYGGDTVDTDFNGYPDDNFYMFNTNNNKYTVPLHVGNKPRGRYGHQIGVVLMGTLLLRLYLFGGQLENEVFSDLYYFELTRFKQAKARWELVLPENNFRPPPLTNHLMVVLNRKLYVFGGVYNNEKVSNDVWCFDVDANRWLQVSTTGMPPLPVNEHSASLVGDRMYVYGGNDFSGTIYDLLHCLDLRLMKWLRLAADASAGGPGPRCGHLATYLPKLHKLIIMGGDKNDYIRLEHANYDTYEEFDGNELGTMVYELDLAVADHFLQGGAPRRMAASAGGAAAVLSRRAPSPAPLEGGHRRSVLADDFRTPNALMERVHRLLDPKEHENRLLEQSERDPRDHDRFVDVDIPSSAVSQVTGSQPSRALSQYSRVSESEASTHDESRDMTSEHEVTDEVGFFDRNATPVVAETKPETDGLTHASAGNTVLAALGGAGVVGAFSLFRKEREPQRGPEREPERAPDAAMGSPVASGANGHEVKKVVAELTGELAALKQSTAAQMDKASARITKLEQENEQLRRGQDAKAREAEELQARLHEAQAQLQLHASELETSRKRALELQTQHEQHALELRATHEQTLAAHGERAARQVEEKDRIIDELRALVDPLQLEPGVAPAGRGFLEVTKHKLSGLELRNRLVYVENENAALRERLEQFEPFMEAKMADASQLQQVVQAQEEKIALLTAQVRLELALHQELSALRHQLADLQLEHDNYKAVHHGDDVVPPVATHLGLLVERWLAARAPPERAVASPDHPMVVLLQKQVDDLTLTAQQHHQGALAEVEALELELNGKLSALAQLESQYKDAISSVNNTSKALQLTQDELQSQKLAMDKLAKENSELKMAQAASELPEGPAGVLSAHYNMRLKDLEADLYILKQERNLLNDTVATLKKQLYLAQNGA